MKNDIDTVDYDNIPAEVLGDYLLEIGPGSGEIQLASKHGEWFKSLTKEYHWKGIEKKPFLGGAPYLHYCETIENLCKSDFCPGLFDTIIASHVIEHVDIRDWKETFDKLLYWLKPGGHLIIMVPYKEKHLPAFQVYEAKDLDHSVYHINKKLLRHFIPGKIKFNLFLRVVFRDKGESFWRALGRYFKRVIKGHYYVTGMFPGRLILMAIHKKEAELDD